MPYLYISRIIFSGTILAMAVYVLYDFFQDAEPAYVPPPVGPDLQNPQIEDFDWYNNAGDPLVIPMSNASLSIPPLFPDQYEAWDIDGHDFQDRLFYFDYNCDGKNQMGDRNPVGTLTLYIDYDGNERITNGCEVMWSYYTPVHEIMSQKDLNHDGKIDSQDSIWPKIRMSDWNESWTPEELGYIEFDLNYITLQHDECHGFIGTYANGAAGYIKDEKYYECLEQGWEPIEPISPNTLRVVGYNPCGGLHEEFGCVMIYSGILGYWEKVN